MNGNEIKLVTFADDMTTIVCDKPSHLTLIGVINLFGTHSGLKINHEKTEALLPVSYTHLTLPTKRIV